MQGGGSRDLRDKVLEFVCEPLLLVRDVGCRGGVSRGRSIYVHRGAWGATRWDFGVLRGVEHRGKIEVDASASSTRARRCAWKLHLVAGTPQRGHDPVAGAPHRADGRVGEELVRARDEIRALR